MGNGMYLYFAVMAGSLVLIGMQIVWFTQHWGIVGLVAGVLFFPVLTPLFPFISRDVDEAWPLAWLSIFGILFAGILAGGILSKTSKSQK